MQGFLEAVALLTTLGGARPLSRHTTAWLGVVGLGLGAALGGLWWLASRLWGGLVPAAVVLGADLGLTGMLHLDGLADSADGLLAHMSATRRLEVMASPEVGSFAVGACAVVLALRLAALADLAPSVLALAGLWGLSRSAMAAVVASQPYARGPEGMAGSLGRPRHPALIALSALASVGALMAWRPLPGLAVACGCLAAAALVTAVARRKLGGYTGDVLGAVAIVGETTGLVVAAARW